MSRPSGLQDTPRKRGLGQQTLVPSKTKACSPVATSNTAPAPASSFGAHVLSTATSPPFRLRAVSIANGTRTFETSRSLDRFKIRTSAESASPQAAATSEPSALNEGPHAPPSPERLETTPPADVSQTFNVSSPPVEASNDPSGLKATSFTSPSCPWNERTLSPVSDSLLSIRPESSGPSVTKAPRGLQTRRPPNPGTP